MEIVNLDKLTYAGNIKNLQGLEKERRYSFIKGDICDPKIAKEAMDGCDSVVNFAAETHVDRSIEKAQDFVLANVVGVHNLLETARKLDIGLFVQISTDEVYGSIEQGSFTEESPISPNSPYSASKAGADLLCRSYFVTHGFPVLITRSSNNFGPYQHPEKLIPKFITNAMRGIPLPLYGDGLNVRDWIFVEDNCSGIEAAMKGGKPGQIYNVGGGNETTNLEITKLILAKLGKPASLIKKVEDRKGHDRRYSLDSSKLMGLGWKMSRKFESALDETITWYKKNEKWWAGLLQ
ncbi:MAG: dTDP-glucose 4,6-dehydratase [Candidatus Micrarchaeota archaeon]